MASTKSVKRTARRDGVQVANFLNINGLVLALGDVRKSEFEGIDNPKASVKSCQEAIISILNILRGPLEEAQA